MRVMNHRVAVTGRRPAFDMTVFAPPEGDVASAQRGSRTVWA